MLNTGYYFLFRNFYANTTFHFAKLSRTFFFFTMYHFAYLGLKIEPVFKENYKININNLFDRDYDFLYKNEHFRGLVRRVFRLYPDLINPNFEMDE